MTETTDTGNDDSKRHFAGLAIAMSEVDAWFAREVLPLEAVLMQFLRRNWRNRDEIPDLLQDIYVRVYEAALNDIPRSVKPFVFQTARNLISNKVRHQQVVPIEAVADLDLLNVVADEPGPDRTVGARDELRRLQSALDALPRRAREAFLLRQIEGLSRREIATRMGVSEKTVRWHLNEGLRALADAFYSEPRHLKG